MILHSIPMSLERSVILDFAWRRCPNLTMNLPCLYFPRSSGRTLVWTTGSAVSQSISETARALWEQSGFYISFLLASLSGFISSRERFLHIFHVQVGLARLSPPDLRETVGASTFHFTSDDSL